MNSLDLYEGLQRVIEDMDLIKREAKVILTDKLKVGDQLQIRFSATVSSSTGQKSTMVGFDDVLLELMDKLTTGPLDCHVIPIVGMGGIGKTTLAKNIYAHSIIKEHFDVCAWAKISQQYNSREILCELVYQANKEGNLKLRKMREDEVGLALHKNLSHRRFLIVLDDMWSVEAWEKIQRFFPDNSNSSRIVVTTRLSNLSSQLDNNNYSLEVKFLDKVSSWNLFSKIVFGEKSCPLELEKVGRKIVENCRGLPLSIVVTGGLLEKQEHTKECWESFGRHLSSVVNLENDEHCLKILKLSYDHLPVHLKPCFLYMGVFEEDREIRATKIIKLWVSEGFLKPVSGKSLETIARECLKDLIDRNLILDMLGTTGNVKYCIIHDLLRDLCLIEARKERFYHVVGGTYSQRRIVIPRSTSKERVIDALESKPLARSYISDNATIRRLPNSRFLRILEAYERYGNQYFGHSYVLRNMFEFVNSRYLAVGAHRHAKLPTSIDQLWNLQTLIVAHPRKVDAPVEIWKMPQLRHVIFYKRELRLPDPPSEHFVIMENLQTLKGIRNFKCDQEVVKRIPNIKKLGLTYSKDKGIGVHDDDYDYYCLGNFECLLKLESLSCKGSRFDDYVHMATFPHCLRKLSLEAILFYWQEVLEKISWLPLLEKLELTCGHFRGGEWETKEGGFRSLKFLSLNFCFNFEQWTTESSHFPCLEHLYLRGLEKLKEIPTEIGDIVTLRSIVLDFCCESAEESTRQVVEKQEELQREIAVVVRRMNRELDTYKVLKHGFKAKISRKLAQSI
ncbi:late blight resistance protein R1-A-like [Salvia miltiorrhiza]|uniref:late blight resistance protein R1-A-like n=1 Tax=Salvia miltiorrhiza TaxID=226208 RepID=UPI0025ACDB6B|nr:late blight resistance protein R1-A-like [Salvia miltiorrhiza]